MSDNPHNPFLLPPGGARPESRPEGATESVVQRDASAGAPAAADPSHYIAVPASVESATHRIARPAQEPAAGPIIEAADPETAVEDTRVAPPRRWALVLPDGTRVSLDAPTLIGRDPAGIPDRPGASLLPVADSGKTVSKTHALLEPAAEGVRVRDLHSTTGVAIETAAGRQVVSPGGEGVAPSGATVMLGSFAIRIAG
jgi:hypothetical protein